MDALTSLVKTRFLILSDTHGLQFPHGKRPMHPVDVVIHCGDLTDESKLDELHKTIQMLKEIPAPLKLVIAGNHDFSLDIPTFKKKVEHAPLPLDPDFVLREYGAYGEAERILKAAAEKDGLVFLDEGTYQFELNNGAILRVYASPYTPASRDDLGPGDEGGFQYRPSQGHDFNIPGDIDVAITHGPPKGIMDRTQDRERIGCQQLFVAIARSRPLLHCFGHVHRMDAKLVAWRQNRCEDKVLSHFTAIDNNNSPRLHHVDGEFLNPLTANMRGTKTIFLNSALQQEADDQWLSNKPWALQLELPRAQCQPDEMHS